MTWGNVPVVAVFQLVKVAVIVPEAMKLAGKVMVAFCPLVRAVAIVKETVTDFACQLHCFRNNHCNFNQLEDGNNWNIAPSHCRS